MILSILRGLFILLAASVIVLYVIPFQENEGVDFYRATLMVGFTLGIAGFIILVDVLTPQKKLSAVSGVFLGLLAGLLAAYALSFFVDFIGILLQPRDRPQRDNWRELLEGVKVLIGLVTCYLAISLVLQTKNDFRFVIPYVEFARETRGSRPVILDSSVIIDGRILDIIDSHIIQASLIVPKFILNELQTIADSHDKTRRARGRRGLDMLKKLQEKPVVDVVLEDAPADGATVDQKLVDLAQRIKARVMTTDYNLGKIAAVKGIDVINLNELAKAMRPTVLPGEHLHVKIIRPGEAAMQGVGYLEDGTMVVVEHARDLVGQEVEVSVTSTLQTSAGRMIFGRALDATDHNPTHPNEPAPPPAPQHQPSHSPAPRNPRPSRPNRPGRVES